MKTVFFEFEILPTRDKDDLYGLLIIPVAGPLNYDIYYN